MSLNGATIPGTQRSFKLNWASHGTTKPGAEVGGPGSQVASGPGGQFGGHMQPPQTQQMNQWGAQVGAGPQNPHSAASMANIVATIGPN